MLPKPLTDIQAHDLDQLVANSVAEGRTLEFKAELPGPRDEDVREFLADATSLANTDGGDLIFGVKDKEGVAVDASGLTLSASLDATLLRLENLLRDCVDPRLSGARFHWVEKGAGSGLLVVRLPPSVSAPHRIKFKGSGKFYHRNSRGKAEMDVHELRLAFTSSEGLPARLRQLHELTTRQIEERDLPFSLSGDAKAVLSVLPLGMLRDAYHLEFDRTSAVYPPTRSGAIDWLATLDGFYVYSVERAEHVGDFALSRPSGQVDVCWRIGRVSDDGEKVMWPYPVERLAYEKVGAAKTSLIGKGVEGPFVAFLSLIDIKGYRVCLDEWSGHKPKEAWKSRVSLPPVSLEVLTPDAFMPLAKSLWLAMTEVRPNEPLGGRA